MHWLAPIWLIGLIPWGALVAWMLLGRPRSQVVPFLMLWERSGPAPTHRRRVHPPARHLVAMLLGVALLIIAAGQPRLGRGGGGAPVTLIVDRSLPMSAPTPDGPRYRRLARELAEHNVFTDVRVLAVPATGGAIQTGADWLGAVDALPPTAIDTRDQLAQTIRRELSRTSNHLIVLTDQPLELDDARVRIFGPAGTLENIAITHLGARADDSGGAAVLVRLRNDSPESHATLVLRSGSVGSRHAIKLPPPGAQRDYILPLPSAGEVIQATVSPGGDVIDDDTAWLLRHGAWPILETTGAVPPALARMIRVYRAHRPASDDSSRVRIASVKSEMRTDQPVVWLAATPGVPPTNAAITIRPHPVMQEVNLDDLIPSASIAATRPPPGFVPVVSVGDQPLVAVRDAPVRGVWVGFGSQAFEHDPASVIFWTNVFDWLGGDEVVYSAAQVHQLGAGWRRIEPPTAAPAPEPGLLAGIWRGPGGERIALNAAPVPMASPPRLESPAPFSNLQREGGFSLSPWLIVGACACLLAAMLTWPARRLDSPLRQA